MNKTEKIQAIKEFTKNNNNSISLPDIEHLDSFNEPRTMSRVYRGIVQNKPTNYYFVETSTSTACIDVVTDDAIEKLFNFLSEKFADSKK